MKYFIEKNISCSNSLQCSNNIREKIESKFICKIMSTKDNDIVNGSISILHEKRNHKITVEFYEKNETQNVGAAFEKLKNIPTQTEIEHAI